MATGERTYEDFTRSPHRHSRGRHCECPDRPDRTEVRSGLGEADSRCSGRNSIDPGRLAFQGVPLKAVLMEALKVTMDQIEGPFWLEADCFDIFAKFPEGATSEQLPAMLQAFLVERFKLAAHKQDRPSSGYALVVDKGGPKLKEDDPKGEFMGAGHAGQMLFGAFGHGRLKGVMTMATLAANLSRQGYGPVQDLTGLTGTSTSLGHRTRPSDRSQATQLPLRPRRQSPRFPRLDRASLGRFGNRWV